MIDPTVCRNCGHSARSHDMDITTLLLGRCNAVIAYERKGKVLCGCEGWGT